MIDFADRVAIVTGAGGGLGRSHALALAARGAAVIVNDLGGTVGGEGSSTRAADAVVAEIRSAGGVAVASYDSVSDPAGGEAMTALAVEEFGRIDIVVNNAGILRDRSFAKLPWEDLDAVLDVHLKGAFYVSRPAFLQMKEQGYGRIVMTSSGSGVFGNFGQSNYGAAKMGLVGLVNVLAQEGARSGILVNAIAPLARTRMTEDLLGPLAEHLDPELVTPAVVYLASEACGISGDLWSVSGGRVTRVVHAHPPGFFKHPEREGALTVEDVADHLGEIRSLEDLVVPGSLQEDIVGIGTLLGG
jgi:NAD(P)-dependent dehydrogenase (short-subunit alcohol dehydrogenase family)